ncbi:MAG: penicillin acylase family protein, partial [Gammaproteobacteria bacterium]|nr:penicillin acylase family protein [Gammaproteobacteria bacterium]
MIGSTWLYIQLNNSLAILSGQIMTPGLSQPVSIQRDQLGAVTLSAANRLDIAHATGFVHAQDRFFQMDLLRRQAAGELSELLGKTALNSDQAVRIHRFRQHANEAFNQSPQPIQALLIAYAAGVNRGLSELKSSPIEYLLLRTSARPWQQEDSFLVLYAMFLELQDSQGRFDQQMGSLRDTLPPPLFQFLTPSYTQWDAPINRMDKPESAIPDTVADFLDETNNRKIRAKEKSEPSIDSPAIGSNSWAVSGALTNYDSALLAGDMHLPLRIPNTWYRLRIQWSDSKKRDITGVTIPGSPLMIVGSNRAIAWAFTNSYGDWSDII